MDKNGLRRLIGALALDLPGSWIKTLRANDWVRLRNRMDDVEIRKHPLSVRVNAPYSSTLHVCDVFPSFGQRLLRKVSKNWTFELSPDVQFSDAPDVTFVIPHRGRHREHLLEMTIRSIGASLGNIECIVVEQDEKRRLGDLPGNTRHVLARHPVENENWHKAFAFNAGVREARARIVVLHDGDILIPKEYPQAIMQHMLDGQTEVAFLQRFLFYLSESATAGIVQNTDAELSSIRSLEMIKQNWVGGTVAIRKDAFAAIGGFDEDFHGWTGEDREFHDRCRMLNGWFFGYVPFLHLWHPNQEQKSRDDLRTDSEEFTRRKLAVDPKARIERLLKRETQHSK